MSEGLVVILIICFVALMIGLIRWGIKQSELWKQALATVAQRLGLVYVDGGFWKASAASGTVDNMVLKIDSYTVSTGKSSQTYTRIVLDGGRKIPHGLQLKSEGMMSSIKKAFAGSDLITGDELFDERVFLKGHDLDTISRLDGNTRQAALAVVSGLKGTVGEGKIRITKSGLVRDPDKLESMARGVIALARGLAGGQKDPAERLARNAREDSDAGIRLNNLRLLTASYPQHPATATTIEKALDDPDSSIRLHAALAGSENVETLRDLATSEGIPASDRARALKHLVAAVGNQAIDALREALSCHSVRVREAAIHGIGQVGDRTTQTLLIHLVEDPEPRIATALATALGFVEHPDVEQALLRLLEHDADDVKIATAASLGRVGSVKAVEPLLEYTKGLLLGGDLKDQARQAIESIQSRLGDADHGQLSLSPVGVASGGLSVEQAQGKLSQASEVSEEQEHVAVAAETKKPNARKR